MKKYKLIKQDTFNKLEVGKIYNIKDFGNHYSIMNDAKEEYYQIPLYQINQWQLDNMFEEVN